MAGKMEIVDYLAKNVDGLTKKTAKEVVDAFIDGLQEVLLETGYVRLPNLGTFKISMRKERTGRNPRTKEVIKIPATKVVKFNPASSLKEKVAKS